MKKVLTIIAISAIMTGCATYPNSSQQVYNSQGDQLVFHNGAYYRAGTVPQEQYQQRAGADRGGAMIGTIAGGLLGSQVGRGNGRIAATAVGAAIGGVVGSGCRTTNGGQVLGALAGGILGSKVGGGNGQLAATAIGASVGAQAGGDMAGGCVGN